MSQPTDYVSRIYCYYLAHVSLRMGVSWFYLGCTMTLTVCVIHFEYGVISLDQWKLLLYGKRFPFQNLKTYSVTKPEYAKDWLSLTRVP